MTATLGTTPAADGFRMPGEFERHLGTWMVWPERPDNWRLGAKPAQDAFVAVATAIAAAEPVTMAVSARQYANCRSSLPAHVRVVEMANDDSWMRDIGPTFVVDDRGGLRGVDWVFNAWGGLVDGLYFPWDLDDAVAQKVCEIEGADRYRATIVLEGGSIHSDGEGTLFVTEECLLSRGRNPGLSKAEIERELVAYTRAEKVLWLDRGVHLDETNGHVDNLVNVVRPGLVLLTWTDDASDPQHEISADARRRLESWTDARGRSIEVLTLPSPGPVHITEEESAGVDAVDGTLPRLPGDRLAASYANAYLCNGRVVVPLLDERVDDEALDVYGKAFPDRDIVGVPAREVLLGGGNIHCITQQVPDPRA
ncbi:MAG TPA: agmatine deiminase [Acidimicrobiales bacterium]|nr:agmatine deiminase [Acidimicrobiales bacterium]